MKIERTNSVGSSPIKRGERSQNSGSGKFAKEVVGQESTVDPVSVASPAHAVDALLAIQEVDDATVNEKGYKLAPDIESTLYARVLLFEAIEFS